jgi:glycosyltransferase involved in cell wall biosynthesis
MNEIITIIPAYNEEKTIKWVVEGALQYSDVLVVNDGSIDRTHQISEDAGAQVVSHSKNRGKGAAIKTGLKNALKYNYKILILMDGDGQHDPKYIPILARATEDAGIVIGSRFKEAVPENMPLQRRFSNKLTTKLIDYITGYHVTDSQSGFRAISRPSAELILEVPYNDYVFESEVIYVASKNGIILKEVGISCNYQDEKSYINLINILNYLFYVLRLFIRKMLNYKD